MMKALLAALGSAVLSSFDPGCGSSLGSNAANGPDGSVYVPVGDTSCSAATHGFCDGFERPAPSLFDGADLQSGRVSVAAGALLASTDRVTVGTRTQARLKKAFPTTATHFTLAYSEKVDSACIGVGDAVETGVIALRSNSYWVAVRHGKDQDSISEAGVANESLIQSHVLQSKLPRDTFARIVLDVDLTKNTIDLSVDGHQVVADEPLKEPPSSPQAPQIEVGVLTDNLVAPPGPCSVSIDDVAFDSR